MTWLHELEGRLLGMLSLYFDERIPKWLRSKRGLRKEVKRQFLVEMKKELQKLAKEDEDKILYGDPSGCKPAGIIKGGLRNGKG